MTFQEFAKENPDFWQWIAHGKKFRFWDRDKGKSVVGYIGVINFSANSEYPFFCVDTDESFRNAEPIKTVKKPVSFAEAIKFFEESEDYSFSQRSGIYGYRYINNNGKSEFASIGWIREVCTGRKPLPDFFLCEEVEE